MHLGLDQNLMQQFLYPPELLLTKIDSHTAYRASFGGMFWIFIISNHSDRLPHKAVFLSNEGRLPVFKIGVEALRFMHRLALDFSAAGMLDERWCSKKIQKPNRVAREVVLPSPHTT